MGQLSLLTVSSPCLGCADRTVEPNCHNSCEKYAAFRAQIDANKAGKERTIMLADAKWQSLGRKRRKKKREDA